MTERVARRSLTIHITDSGIKHNLLISKQKQLINCNE